MNAIELSREMKKLTIWLDEQKNEPDLVRKHVPNPSYEDCYFTINPSKQGPFPSANQNAIYLHGCSEGESTEFIEAAIAKYREAEIKKFFVHLSPGPKMAAMRRLLRIQGFKLFGGTGYPVFFRDSVELAPYRSAFTIRELSADEMHGYADALDPKIRDNYLSTAGKPGFYHFAAFDDDKPVSVATLCVFGDMGYLMNASTPEAYRKQGGQQALISHRIEKAKSLGCKYFTAQTLYMLQSSIHNLERKGFREVYAKEVYVEDRATIVPVG